MSKKEKIKKVLKKIISLLKVIFLCCMFIIDFFLILAYGIKGVFVVPLLVVFSLFIFIGTPIYALYIVLSQFYMSLIYVF